MSTEGFRMRIYLLRLACSISLAVAGLCDAGVAQEWQAGAGFRSARCMVAAGGTPGFTLLPGSMTGIVFTNFLPQSRHLTNQILLNGSGVAAGDVDGDGWCDLYFCALERPNALYRNLGGWKFENITASAGVGLPGAVSTGAVLADWEGDGDLDLLVNTVGNGTRILLNDGRANFHEAAVLNPGKGGMSLALGDLDGDGFLDLYIANYRARALMDMPNTLFNFAVQDGRRVLARVNGRPVTDPEFANRFRVNARGGIEEDGELDEAYRNNGGASVTPLSFTDGTFLDEDGRALAGPPFEWGLSVMIRDLNLDGLPDLYVCNDFDSPDRVWLNQGAGKFRAAPRLAFRKGSHFSMGLDVADVNRDGLDDIFVVDMLSRDQVTRMDMQSDRNLDAAPPGVFDNRPTYMMNTLFLGRGDGTYAEISQMAGLAATEWSWTTLFLDVDLDGYEDLLVANGNERASRSMDVADRLRVLRTARQLSSQEIFENRKQFPRQNSPNLAFRNRGDLTFEDLSRLWGFDFNGVSHGMALADLDNDGDQDVVVNNLNAPAGIYRNNSAAPRVAVRLKGKAPNTHGIGARVAVRGGAVPVQAQEVMAGGRYLSSDDPMRVFAAGSATNAMTIEVVWRSGRQSVVTGVRANRIYVVDEAGATGRSTFAAQVRTSNPTNTLFEDVSARLNHTHADEPFDDFARQPTLANKLSQLGPGVTWADVDADGWEDLILGSGRGGRPGVFRNDGRGGFGAMNAAFLDAPVIRDQTTVLPWRNSSGDLVLLAGSANYEDRSTNGSCVCGYNLTRNRIEDSFPGGVTSSGPLAMADLDGDGKLDLFVGGRAVAGRYPEAATSSIFRETGERFEIDVARTAQLAGVGPVSGAVFTDLDEDGDAELVIVSDWGPPRIFRNDGGKLVSWNPAVTHGSGGVAQPPKGPLHAKPDRMSQFTGWWNGVTAGDFDGDGRMDLAASNWGRNTHYQVHRGRPLQLVYGDFDDDGIIEWVECHYDSDEKRLFAERTLESLGRAMPFLRVRFPSHRAFGQASVQEILGDRWPAAKQLEARWLESTIFLNRGDHFEARVLPVDAQMAPAFAVCAGDLDGDGRQDLFLSQNFFSVQPETPRCDAGLGLCLRGDGEGGFQPVPGAESGIRVFGEQRGAAICDFDHDGRLDLAVAQNSAQTRLFRNRSAIPGIRVRLLGPPGNPEAVGAILRGFAGTEGWPVQEIHAGSGYWSMDGAVRIIPPSAARVSLQVRWPGGARTTNALPSGAIEVSLDTSGTLKIVR